MLDTEHYMVHPGEDASPKLHRVANDIVRAIRRYVILSEQEAAMVALWVLHAATIEAHQSSPRLSITSPFPNCGKTTLCGVIAQLLGVRVRSNVTIAAFFRTVEKNGPQTVILDEADTFLSANNREGIGILNSGHGRTGAYVSRTEHTADGGMEPRDFSTWAPVVFGLIGSLPAAALKSRCLSVLLKRKRPSETVERLRENDPGLAELRARILSWSGENLKALRQADPELPTGLYNRDQDNWRPLLACADAIGGRWPERARRIAQEMNGLAEDPSEGVMLLADIRRLFAERQADPAIEPRDKDRISSASLVTALGKLTDRPWNDFRDQVFGITDRQLAALLGLCGIKPATVRIGSQTPKGYRLAQFAEAFERYLPEAASDVADAVAADVADAEGERVSKIKLVSAVAAEPRKVGARA